MSKHTPGPWKYDRALGLISDSKKRLVTYDTADIPESACDVDGDPPEDMVAECDANGYLMAAAPDLLEVLTRMEKAATVLHNAEGVAVDVCDCKTCAASRELYEATKAARAAIAKAEGESR